MQQNSQLETILNNYRKRTQPISLMQCGANQNNNLNHHNKLFNGTYKLLNHEIKAKPYIEDLIKQKGSHYPNQQIHNHKQNQVRIQKNNLGEELNQSSNQSSSIERKIIGLNKLKQLTKQRQSYDKKDQKIRQIRLGGKRKQINLFTIKYTQQKQINTHFTTNLITQQSKESRDMKSMKHNQSIESKSLEKKFNIERSIQRFKILKSLADDHQDKKSELQSNNKSELQLSHKQGKRQIKSFKVLTKKQIKKNQESNCNNQQHICKTQTNQNKQNQISFSNQTIPSLKKENLNSHSTNMFVLEKRQIKIVTSKTFNKKINESKENLTKNQVASTTVDQRNKFCMKTFLN